jgi:hypothetical protein
MINQWIQDVMIKKDACFVISAFFPPPTEFLLSDFFAHHPPPVYIVTTLRDSFRRKERKVTQNGRRALTPRVCWSQDVLTPGQGEKLVTNCNSVMYGIRYPECTFEK